MHCGPVRHTITATTQVETAARRVLIAREPPFDVTTLPPDPAIQEVLSAVAADRNRTERIAPDVLRKLAEERFPLVLTERREHLDALAELVAADTDRVAVFTAVSASAPGDGSTSCWPRRVHASCSPPAATSGRDSTTRASTHSCSRCRSPGRDHDPVRRPAAPPPRAKHEIRVIDYVDHAVPVLRRMFAKRQRAYAALGYTPG